MTTSQEIIQANTAEHPSVTEEVMTSILDDLSKVVQFDKEYAKAIALGSIAATSSLLGPDSIRQALAVLGIDSLKRVADAIMLRSVLSQYLRHRTLDLPTTHKNTPLLRSLWECVDCRFHCPWSWQDVETSGTPVCPTCNRDMALLLEP